ncbi:hypothetical protein [Streptomyces yangpuensis]|uniref:hypothetical protein n=1 Tax=Streptomyces yangpuensis TaxID=1648182 RepID=UPI00365A4282
MDVDLAALFAVLVTPPADGSSGDAQTLGHDPVRHTSAQQKDCFFAYRGIVLHVRELCRHSAGRSQFEVSFTATSEDREIHLATLKSKEKYPGSDSNRR